jgi:hypothetical protein
LLRHFEQWFESRKRVRDEFRFHLDRLVDESLRAGLPLADAKKAAKRRLGAKLRHKREAYLELGARWRDLLSPELLDGLSPRLRQFTVIGLAICLGVFFGDRFSFLLTMWCWIPVLVTTIVSASITSLMSGGSTSSRNMLGVVSLTSTASISFAALSLTFAFWRAVKWPTVGLSVLAFSVLGVINIYVALLLLSNGYSSWKSRCPQCWARLRLPSRMLFFPNFVVKIDSTELICPFGHGTSVRDHWGEVWHSSGDFWNAIYTAGTK